MNYELTNLQALEAESIHIIREVAAEFERPVLLFSGGKDSIVMLRLAEKAFWPARIPFPVMHVDTGHNFDEVYEFRDRRVAELGVKLIVASVQESIDKGRVVEQTGPRASRNQLQTVTLLDAIEEHGFDAAFGGARRDEERARAKERVYSFRDEFGQWDPKNQRPELWALYNGRHRRGEHIRVFPLSNWTELDIWQYIEAEGIEVPSIYFAHEREVFQRDGMWLAVTPYITLMEGEEPEVRTVRYRTVGGVRLDGAGARRVADYRTVGDASCTGAVESNAADIAAVIAEISATRITERGATRADDRASEAAMEDRKREGYF
jgi:sulfate adenylyltransferase subunit 2